MNNYVSVDRAATESVNPTFSWMMALTIIMIMVVAVAVGIYYRKYSFVKGKKARFAINIYQRILVTIAFTFVCYIEHFKGIYQISINFLKNNEGTDVSYAAFGAWFAIIAFGFFLVSTLYILMRNLSYNVLSKPIIKVGERLWDVIEQLS